MIYLARFAAVVFVALLFVAAIIGAFQVFRTVLPPVAR